MRNLSYLFVFCITACVLLIPQQSQAAYSYSDGWPKWIDRIDTVATTDSLHFMDTYMYNTIPEREMRVVNIPEYIRPLHYMSIVEPTHSVNSRVLPPTIVQTGNSLVSEPGWPTWIGRL